MSLSFLPVSVDKRPSFVEEICRQAWHQAERDTGYGSRRGGAQGLALVEHPVVAITFLRALLDVAKARDIPAEEMPAFLALGTLPWWMLVGLSHRTHPSRRPQWPNIEWVTRGRRGKKAAIIEILELALEHEDAFWFERAAGLGPPEIPQAPYSWARRLSPEWNLRTDGPAAMRAYRVPLGKVVPPQPMTRQRGARRTRDGAKPRIASGLEARFSIEIGFCVDGNCHVDRTWWPAGEGFVQGMPYPRLFRLCLTMIRAGRGAHGKTAETPTGRARRQAAAQALREGVGMRGTIPPEYILKSVYFLREGEGNPLLAAEPRPLQFRYVKELLPLDAPPDALELMLGISWLRSSRSLTEQNHDAEEECDKSPPPQNTLRSGRLTGGERRLLEQKVARRILTLASEEAEAARANDEHYPEIDPRRADTTARRELQRLSKSSPVGDEALPWLQADSLDNLLRACLRDARLPSLLHKTTPLRDR
jgi:hypothetical protein